MSPQRKSHETPHGDGMSGQRYEYRAVTLGGGSQSGSPEIQKLLTKMSADGWRLVPISIAVPASDRPTLVFEREVRDEPV